MNITIIGTGYVGLVTGACFSDKGFHVTCLDNNLEKIENLKKGIVPIYEPGLEEIVLRNYNNGNLEFTTDLKYACEKSEIFFLALPTPADEDGSADLSHVLEVVLQIAQITQEHKIIVDKSTVPVGTAEKLRKRLKKITTQEFSIVSNPEFLREGFAVQDFMNPERVVIGSRCEKTAQIIKSLYLPFVKKESQILLMDEKSSELTKYAANAFLATKISFMNEIANFCKIVGADVDKVREGIGTDSRIGSKFLYSGIGYGGSCFPKDVKALRISGKEKGYDFKILESVMEVNENQKQVICKKIEAYFGEGLEGKTIAVWGLSFKPDTDDIREAPALEIIKFLLNKKVKIKVYDSHAEKHVKKIFTNGIEYCKSSQEAVEKADALVIATEWKEFIEVDIKKVLEMLLNPIIFDGRNIYSIAKMREYKVYYESIGREIINNL